MRVVTIINPVSGAMRQRDKLRHMLSRLRDMGFSVACSTTRGPGDAVCLAAQAADQEVDAVIVVGGDGTACEAANGLSGSPTPMLLWPAGTENLAARSLGFQANERTIVDALTVGRVISLDLGRANGKSFMIIAGIGFDAEVVHRLTRLRRGHITHLSYAGPIWRTFWEHRFPLLRVHSEGQPCWEGRGLVFIGNFARYALGLPVVRDALPDDGLLDLLVLPCRGRLGLVGHSLRTLVRRHVEHQGVLYRRVTRVRVESDVPVPVELDGDALGMLPIEVSVRPAAVRVQVPPSASGGYNPGGS